jgi:hypothetical protein
MGSLQLAVDRVVRGCPIRAVRRKGRPERIEASDIVGEPGAAHHVGVPFLGAEDLLALLHQEVELELLLGGPGASQRLEASHGEGVDGRPGGIDGFDDILVSVAQCLLASAGSLDEGVDPSGEADQGASLRIVGGEQLPRRLGGSSHPKEPNHHVGDPGVGDLVTRDLVQGA